MRCVCFFFHSLSFFSPNSDSKFNLHSAKTPDRKSSSVDITDTPSGSSAFASKSDSTEHLERLRQKLHQLRSLPSTSCDFEQSIAVSIESPPPATTSTEPDLDQDEILDIIYERRPSVSVAVPKEKALEFQFLATRSTSLQRTPRSLNEHNGLLQTVTSWTTSKFSPTRFTTPSTASTSELMSSGSSSILSPASIFRAEKRSGKVLGPHCTQFLAKIGLLKGTHSADHSMELDDHQCFKSNETVCITPIYVTLAISKLCLLHLVVFFFRLFSFSAIVGNNATDKSFPSLHGVNQSASKSI